MEIRKNSDSPEERDPERSGETAGDRNLVNDEDNLDTRNVSSDIEEGDEDYDDEELADDLEADNDDLDDVDDLDEDEEDEQ
jgi:hypothetical protein